VTATSGTSSSGWSRERAAAPAVLAIGAVLVHLAFLAWDRSKDLDPVTGSESGPYDTWQVVGSTLALGLLAVVGGRARRAWSSAAAITAGFTVTWAVSAATGPAEDADLWPIGAVATGIGTFLWTAAIALATRRATGRTPRPSPSTP